MHIIYTYLYKSFSTMLDKAWERTSKKKKEERGGEIAKYKQNELGVMNMK